jgi:transcriptional regulator GlxA family with amidase domain
MQIDTARIEISRPPALPGIEAVCVLRSPKLWRLFHESYKVYALTDSVGVAWRRGTETNSGYTGDMTFAQPGDLTVATALAQPQSFIGLSISAAVMEKAAEELGVDNGRRAWRASQLSNPSVFARFVHHHRSLMQADCALEAENALADCLPLLFEHCVERRAGAVANGGRSYVLEARDFIHENFSRAFGMEELSRAVRMSRYHLSRAFRACFGVSPHEYLVHVRVARARELLKSGVPIPLVATRTGFSDASHLTRSFRAAFSFTPSHYARAAGSAR